MVIRLYVTHLIIGRIIINKVSATAMIDLGMQKSLLLTDWVTGCEEVRTVANRSDASFIYGSYPVFVFITLCETGHSKAVFPNRFLVTPDNNELVNAEEPPLNKVASTPRYHTESILIPFYDDALKCIQQFHFLRQILVDPM